MAVVCGASSTRSVPSIRPRDLLQDHARDALPDLGGGAVDERAPVGTPASTRAAQKSSNPSE